MPFRTSQDDQTSCSGDWPTEKRLCQGNSVSPVRSTSRPSSSPLRIADRGDDGARAVGPTDDDDVGFAWSGRRRASAARYLRGLRSTPAKFCSSDMGPRYPFSLPSTRAREASGAMSTDLFDRREPAGRQMVRSTSRPSSSPFYALRIGATMELGRSGRPTMTMSASPGRGGGVRAQRGTYGVIDQRRPNSAAVTWPRYPFSLVFNARARGERGDADGFFFDRREPPGRQMVRSTSRPSASLFLRGPSDDDDVGRRAGRRRRWSSGGWAERRRRCRTAPESAEFCSSDMGRWAHRYDDAGAACGSERSATSGRVIHSR